MLRRSKIIDLKEAAEIIGVTPARVRQLVQGNYLESQKAYGKHFFWRQYVETYSRWRKEDLRKKAEEKAERMRAKKEKEARKKIKEQNIENDYWEKINKSIDEYIREDNSKADHHNSQCENLIPARLEKFVVSVNNASVGPEPMQYTGPRLYTRKGLAKLCDTGVSTIDYWRKRGLGPPHIKMGRRVYYLEDDVNKYLHDSRRRM